MAKNNRFTLALLCPATHRNRSLYFFALLMNLGLRRRSGALEEVEVAALVRLPDVLREERAVAALEFARRGFPGALALHHLCVVDQDLQPAARHVELDRVAGLHQRERPADPGFGRDVQHAAAICRS